MKSSLVFLLILSLPIIAQAAKLTEKVQTARNSVVNEAEARLSSGALTKEDVRRYERTQLYRETWKQQSLESAISALMDSGHKVTTAPYGGKVLYQSNDITIIDDPVGQYFRIKSGSCDSPSSCFLDSELNTLRSTIEGENAVINSETLQQMLGHSRYYRDNERIIFFGSTAGKQLMFQREPKKAMKIAKDQFNANSHFSYSSQDDLSNIKKYIESYKENFPGIYKLLSEANPKMRTNALQVSSVSELVKPDSSNDEALAALMNFSYGETNTYVMQEILNLLKRSYPSTKDFSLWKPVFDNWKSVIYDTNIYTTQARIAVNNIESKILDLLNQGNASACTQALAK